ncbi:hypothetical protein HBI24_165190 [Parastagonospora nodorum]|nr:hypothetical protein HBH53_119850 [Parastagonospora nodorum]KAH4052659.1 hypothetical protein HBH49_104520 [Parastagonospora nodorum]KAH4135296.1 hypothetical protein HBH45_155120 [Parastagonospora nodorum]KAH4171166.1 hypothetical protein HBH43_094880 [Parastagonospora nodorum]KAH4196213.1 hypothetical protein HBI95_189390 [Parastagonospora nodorum]
MSLRAFFSSPPSTTARFCRYGVEDAGGAVDGAVCRVFVGGCGKGEFVADDTREAHAVPACAFAGLLLLGGRWGEQVCDGIVEAAGLDGIPGTQEDDVAHEDFVFEGGAEVSFGFGKGALDLAADTGDGADGGAFEFCDFERGFEHVFDEGGVLEDLVRVASELELLDDFGRFVDIQDNAGGADPEAGCLVAEALKADKTSVWCDERAVEGTKAMHVLRRVLEHAIARPRI